MRTWETKEFRDFVVNELINEKKSDEQTPPKGILAYNGSVIRRDNGQIVLTPNINNEDKKGIVSSLNVYKDGMNDIVSEPPPPGTPGAHEGPPSFADAIENDVPLFYDPAKNQIVSDSGEGKTKLYINERGILTWNDTGVEATKTALAQHFTQPKEEILKEYTVDPEYQPPPEFDSELNWKGASYTEPIYYDDKTRKFTTLETDIPVYLDADGAMTLDETDNFASYAKIESMALDELDNARLLSLVSSSEDYFPKDTAVRNLIRNDDTEFVYGLDGEPMPVSTQKPGFLGRAVQWGEYTLGSAISAARKQHPAVDFLFDVVDVGMLTFKSAVTKDIDPVLQRQTEAYRAKLAKEKAQTASYDGNFLVAEDWMNSINRPEEPMSEYGTKTELEKVFGRTVADLVKQNADDLKFSYSAMRAYYNPDKYDEEALNNMEMTPRDELLAKYILPQKIEFADLEEMKATGQSPEEIQASLREQTQLRIAEFEQERDTSFSRGERLMKEGNMQDALDAIRYGIEQDRNAQVLNETDEYYAWTWGTEPEREDAFLDAVALVNLQRMYKGQPLMEKWEIQELKYYFADAATEFAGGYVFDLLNVPGADAVISGVTDVLVKGVGVAAQPVVQLGKAKGWDKWWVFQKAHKSTAHKVRYTAVNAFSSIGFDTARVGTDFVDEIGQVGKLIDKAKSANISDPKAILAYIMDNGDNLSSRMTPKQLDKLIGLSDVIDPKDWKNLATSARQAAKDKIVESKLSYYLKKFADEGLEGDNLAKQAQVAAEKYAINAVSNSRTYIPDIAEEFASVYVSKHRAWGGVSKDVKRNTDELIEEMITQVKEEGKLTSPKEIFTEAKARAKAEAVKVANATKGTSRIMDDTLMGVIGKNHPSLRPAFEGWQKIVDTMSSIWVREVLSGRPGWAVINRIDSTYRAIIGGLSPWDGVTALLRSDLKELVEDLGGDVPHELGQVLLEAGKDLEHYTDSVPYRLIFTDWKPAPGMFGFFSFMGYNYKRAWKAGYHEGMGLLDKAGLFLKSLNKARYPAGDMSDLIEFNLRLRLYHKTFIKNVDKIDSTFLRESVTTLSPKAREIAKRWWKQSANRPGKMFEYARGSGNIAFIIPDEVYTQLDKMTPADRNGFAMIIAEALDAKITDVVRGGRAFTDKDLNLFFTDINTQLKKLQLDRMEALKGLKNSAGTLPDAGASKVAGEQIGEIADSLQNHPRPGEYIPSSEEWITKLVAHRSGALDVDDIPKSFTPEFETELRRAGIDPEIYKNPQPFMKGEDSIYSIPHRTCSIEEEKELLSRPPLNEDERELLEHLHHRNQRVQNLNYLEASDLPEERDFQLWVAHRVSNSYYDRQLDLDLINAYLMRKQDDAAKIYVEEVTKLSHAQGEVVNDLPRAQELFAEYDKSPAKWIKQNTPRRVIKGVKGDEAETAREAFEALARKIDIENVDTPVRPVFVNDSGRIEHNSASRPFENITGREAGEDQARINHEFRTEIRNNLSNSPQDADIMASMVVASDSWNFQLSKLSDYFRQILPGPLGTDDTGNLWETYNDLMKRSRSRYSQYLLGLKENVLTEGARESIESISTINFLDANGIKPLYNENDFVGFIFSNLDDTQDLYIKAGIDPITAAGIADAHKADVAHVFLNSEKANALEYTFKLTDKTKAGLSFDPITDSLNWKNAQYKAMSLNDYYNDEVERNMVRAQKRIRDGNYEQGENVLRNSAVKGGISTVNIRKDGSVVPADNHLLNLISRAKGESYGSLSDFIKASNDDIYTANEELRTIMEIRNKQKSIERLDEAAADWRKKVHLALREYVPMPKTKDFIGMEDEYYNFLESTWDAMANYWARGTGLNPDLWYLRKLEEITGEADNLPKLYQTANGPVFYSRLTQVVDESKVSQATGRDWINYLQNRQVRKNELGVTDGLMEWLEESGDTLITRDELRDYIGGHQMYLQEVTRKNARGWRDFDETSAMFSDYIPKYIDPKTYVELELNLPAMKDRISHGHFDPKTAIHVRYGNTVLADGSTVTSIIEIQSDPHELPKDMVRKVLYDAKNKAGIFDDADVYETLEDWQKLVVDNRGYRTQEVLDYIKNIEDKIVVKEEKFLNSIDLPSLETELAGRDLYGNRKRVAIELEEVKNRLDFIDKDKITSVDIWRYVKDNPDEEHLTELFQSLLLDKVIYKDYENLAQDQFKIMNIKSMTVPEFPFKKTYMETAFNRMVRYAVDEGQDSISWVKAVDQYALSQSPVLEWRKIADDRMVLTFKRIDDYTVGVKVVDFTDDKALWEGIRTTVGIGKPGWWDKAFQTIKNAEGEFGEFRPVLGGLEDFYDNRVVSYAEKLARRYGGEIVENTTSTGQKVWTYRFSDAMKAKAQEGFPLLYQTAGIDPEMIKAANRTSRNTPSVGARAITPRYVEKIAKPTDEILDFGAGKAAAHTQRLRSEGLNVTAYEFGDNVVDGLHDTNALNRTYDIVYASNVLNVQGSDEMLDATLDGIVRTLKDENSAVYVNLPVSPRYGAWEGLSNREGADKLEQILKKRFKSVKRVGGTGTAPLFEAKGVMYSLNTDTDNFIKWFTRSVVVDNDGKPLVMYHGTPTGGFKIFANSSPTSLYGPGHYFTDNKSVAKGYGETKDTGVKTYTLSRKPTAEDFDTIRDSINQHGMYPGISYDFEAHLPFTQSRGISDREKVSRLQGILQREAVNPSYNLFRDTITADLGIERREAKQMVYEVYLSIQNPFDIEKIYSMEAAKDEIRRIVGRNIEIGSMSLRTPGKITGDDIYNFLLDYAVEDTGVKRYQIGDVKQVAQNYLRNAGYDGITHIGGKITGGVEHRVYIAFDGTQIKSIDNSGAWNPNNLNIHYQQSTKGTKKAATLFTEQGTAILQYFKSADVSSFFHENGHILLNMLEGEDLQVAAKFLDIDANEFTKLSQQWVKGELIEGTTGYNKYVEAHETFAKTLEKYFLEEIEVGEEFEGIFKKIKRWLRDMYTRIKYMFGDKVEVSKPIKELFDKVFLDLREPGINSQIYKRYGWWSDVIANPNASKADKFAAGITQLANTPISEYPADVQKEVLEWFTTRKSEIDNARNGYRAWNIQDNPAGPGVIASYAGDHSTVPVWSYDLGWRGGYIQKRGQVGGSFSPTYNARYYRGKYGTDALRSLWADILKMEESATAMVAVDAKIKALQQSPAAMKYMSQLTGEVWENYSLGSHLTKLEKIKMRLDNLPSMLNQKMIYDKDKYEVLYDPLAEIYNDLDVVIPREIEEIQEVVNTLFSDSEHYDAIMEDCVNIIESIDKFMQDNDLVFYSANPQTAERVQSYFNYDLKTKGITQNEWVDGIDVFARDRRMPVVNEFQAMFEGDIVRYNKEDWVLVGRDQNNLTLINREKPWVQTVVNSKDNLVFITPDRVGKSGKQLYNQGVANLFDSKPTHTYGNITDSIPEELRDDVDELWKGYINAPRYSDGRSLKDIWGDNITSYSGFKAYITSRIDELSRAGGQYTHNSVFTSYRRLLDQVEQEYTYIASVAFDPKKALAPIDTAKLPDGIQSWVNAVETGLGEMDGYIDLLNTWQTSLAKNLDEVGYDLSKLMDGETLAELQEWTKKGVADKENMIDVAKYGGNDLDGNNIRGAVPHTNTTMLDYTDFGVIDQFMKSILPFWMFPSRSIPWWIGTAATKPRILAFYNKYMRASKTSAYGQKMITSSGQQLPSTVGYFRIPGTQLWFNPAAPISARVAFKLAETVSTTIENKINGSGTSYSGNNSDENNNDLTPMQEIAQIMYNNGNAYGFSMPPWLLLPALNGGLLSKENTPRYSLVPMLDFIPPWTQDSIIGFIAQYTFPGLADKRTQGSLLFSYTPWEDYMIERQMLVDLVDYMNNPTLDESDKMQRAMEVRDIIKRTDREDDPVWNETKRKIQETDYYTKLFGFTTGIYVKEYSDGLAELMKIRNEVNLLRDSVNNGVKSQIFDMYGNPDERWNRYTNYAYGTSVGSVNQLYSDIRFTVYPETGKQAVGMDRRDILADRINVDQQTEAYYEQLSILSQELEKRRHALPVGAASAERQEVWGWYFAQRKQLEDTEMYKYAQRSWSESNKPISMVEDHYEKMWWTMIKETSPRWNPEEQTYADWQHDVAIWEASLPLMGQALMKQFATEIDSKRLFTEQALTGESYFETLAAQTTAEGLKAYDMKTDSVYEALDRAWRALYFDEYWLAVEGKKGTEGRIAEEEFYNKHPQPPSIVELSDWVEDNYMGQFTREELMKSAAGRNTHTIDDRIKAGNTDIENTADEMFDMLGWVGPNGSPMWYEVKDKFIELGGDDSAYDALFYSGGKMEGISNKEKLQSDLEVLRKALDSMGIQKPTLDELKEWRAAEALNKIYKETAAKLFGSDIFDIRSKYYSMYYSEQKDFRKERPDEWERIKNFNEWRNMWTESNTLWRNYYRPDYEMPESEVTVTSGSKPASYSGYGSGKGAYTTYYRRSGGGGGGTTRVAHYFATLGYRTTMDARQLLAPGMLGKGGNGGTLRWSPTTRSAVGSSTIATIEAGDVITKAESQALKNI